MSNVEPSRWRDLAPYSQIVGRDGRPVTVVVGERGSAWWRDAAGATGRTTVDLDGTVARIVPSEGDALTALLGAFPASTVLSVTEE